VVAESNTCLFLILLILLEELSKLFVVLQLSLFHWHYLSNVLFEILKVAHEYFLFFNKVVDVVCVFVQDAFLLIW